MTGLWEQIRQRARLRHAEALAASGGDPSAAALLDAAARLTGVGREAVSTDSPLLDGGQAQLDPEAETIWYNADIDPRLATAHQAHEYGHLWLGDGAAVCTDADLDAEMAEEPSPFGVGRVEGYGPHERRELAANIFAREFLLPATALRRWFLDEGLSAEGIAARVGVLPGLVHHQLTRALLVPELPPEPAPGIDEPGAAGYEAGADPALDPSQAAAAYAEHGPLLLEAGPGTGKTGTLVARIVHLLASGVAPEAILVLTFSNKAAEELRERVARVAPDAAAWVWTGTFHAYGLELLRKHGPRLGLPAKPPICGPVDALFLLERSLLALDLDRYQNLYEPTIALADILGAISRAKDELVGPDRYAELAAAMLAAATTEEEAVAAEKAAEVARVYRFYQAHLEREGQLDFGDLIMRAVELLQGHPDIRATVRATHPHVLVDEYQDVNRASALLLREIAGDGRGLWVVGDIRQAIYRWRGAAPENMRLFEDDFPGGRRLVLARNYRSRPEIVGVVAALAPRMRVTAGLPFTPWAADRPAGGGVLMHVADDPDAECAGLAREIARQRDAGIPLRDQAILCRTHTELARLGAGLERAGVPVLYLGDLFERPEVRDLLALLALACEGDGRGLLRVARFAEYRIPLRDIRALRALASARSVPFPRALDLARDAQDISPAGKAGFARLAGHLEGLCYGSGAWGFLSRYLFERAGFARLAATDDSVAGRQRRAALYQFLQFAHQHRGEPGGDEDPKRAFLRQVRRLETLGEEKQLRRVPEWASDIDAVRLLTVHASKGLEFRAVYLPGLGQGRFPKKRQRQDCPPPAGMLPATAGDAHDEEEECLFFVALSRARDVLCLSRARRYGKNNSNPAGILALIAARLPHPPGGAVTWPAAEGDASPAAPPAAARPPASAVFDVAALDVYIDCPRRYFYEFDLGLGGRRDDSAYMQFHGCVYAVLRWLREERAAGRAIEVEEALARLADRWAEHGPRDHAYEVIYRRNAEAMVRRAVDGARWSEGLADPPTREIVLRHGRVRITPDQVALPAASSAGPPRIQRLRTGHPSKTEGTKDIYALYLALAEQAYPGTGAAVETVYLSTDGDPHQVALGDRARATRLDRYDAAIAGILAGQFPATPDDRACPRCPHYFICPCAEDA